MFPMEVQERGILPNITVTKIYAKPFIFRSTSDVHIIIPISQMKKSRRVG